MTAKKGLRSGGGDKAPWMPKYGADFYGDERVLAMGNDLRGWALRGLYEWLLWKAWQEGSIPADVPTLAAMCGMPKAAFAKLWPAIAPCWKPHPQAVGRLINGRQERVRESSGELSKKMQHLAERRWGRATATAPESEPGCEPHAEPHANTDAEPQCEGASDAGMRSAMLVRSQTSEVREDSQTARGTAPLCGEGVPTPSEYDEARANGAASMAAGLAAARRARA